MNVEDVEDRRGTKSVDGTVISVLYFPILDAPHHPFDPKLIPGDDNLEEEAHQRDR